MKNLLVIFLFVIVGLTSFAQNPTGKQYIPWLKSDAITIPGPADDVTQAGYFIWHGDTIDFSMLRDNTIVLEADSTVLFITLKQLVDSLNSLPGGHLEVTIGTTGTAAGLSVTGQELNQRPATTAVGGYMPAASMVELAGKLSVVTHNYTLTGNGTSASQLKVDTLYIVTKDYLNKQNYIKRSALSYDSLSDLPTLPIISNLAYDAGWDNNMDGASKNSIYDAIESLAGGHDAVSLSSDALSAGLSLVGQELDYQYATSSQNGALKATDWIRFNKDTANNNEIQNLQQVIDIGNTATRSTTAATDSTYLMRTAITQTTGSATNRFYNLKNYTTLSGSANQFIVGGIATFVNHIGTGNITSLGGTPTVLNANSTGTITYLTGDPTVINTALGSTATNIWGKYATIYNRGKFNKLIGGSSWMENYNRDASNNDAYGTANNFHNYGFLDDYSGFQVDAYNEGEMGNFDGLLVGLHGDSLDYMTGINLGGLNSAGYVDHKWTGTPKYTNGIYIDRSIDKGTLGQHAILSESRALSRFYGKFQLDTLRGTGDRFVFANSSGELIVKETENQLLTIKGDSAITNNYGALYNYYAAADTNITSGGGWVVLTNDNINEIITIIGDAFEAAKLLEQNADYWDESNNTGTNTINFSARGSGYRNGNDGAYLRVKNVLHLWSIGGENKDVYIDASYIDAGYDFEPAHGNAIRLTRPATLSEQLLDDGTYVDNYIGNDLQTYKAVKIGTQIWLAENLNERKLRNGSWIDGFDGGVYTPISDVAWAALETGAMCYYNDSIEYAGVLSDVSNPLSLGDSITFNETISGDGTIGNELGVNLSLIPTFSRMRSEIHDSIQNATENDIISAAFSGTTTKTLTLTKQNGSTLTPTFTDISGSGSGISQQLHRGEVTGRNIDVTIADYTPADTDILKVLSDGNIVTGDTVTLSINGGTAYNIFGLTSQDNDYILELMFLNDAWYIMTKMGEEATLKGDVDATNTVFGNTGITLTGVDFESIPDSGLVPKALVLQLIAADNDNVQTLVGTTPYWNVAAGKNARITLTGATTITLANLPIGKEGNLTVVNGGSTSYMITFSGYTFDIHESIRNTTNQVLVSGGTTKDLFSWYYDGVTVMINGGTNFH